MSDGTVGLEVRDGLAWIELDRPQKLNALAGDMREQLRERIGEAAGNPAARALVVTGAGQAFCAGGDVDTMASIRDEARWNDFRKILHAGAECVLALQAYPGLTVAAINGVAAGAGLGLALACDLRIAVPEARLAASWGRVGLAPDWGATYWLPRFIGYSRAMDLVVGGKSLTAAEAHTLGLLHEVVAPQALLPRAAELARERGAAREMVREARTLLRKGLEGSLEASLAAETEVQEELFEGDDVGEGLRALRDRRDPEFGSSR